MIIISVAGNNELLKDLTYLENWKDMTKEDQKVIRKVRMTHYFWLLICIPIDLVSHCNGNPFRSNVCSIDCHSGLH